MVPCLLILQALLLLLIGGVRRMTTRRHRVDSLGNAMKLKYQIPNKQAGFTLIELILYIVLLTMMLTTLIPFAWNVIEGGVKVSVEQEVYSQARYVSERIKK